MSEFLQLFLWGGFLVIVYCLLVYERQIRKSREAREARELEDQLKQIEQERKGQAQTEPSKEATSTPAKL